MVKWLLGITLTVDLALMVFLSQPLTIPMAYERTVKEEIAVVEQQRQQPEVFQALKAAMEGYNLQFAQNQPSPNRVDSYETPGLNLEDYGLETDNAVGYVEIPAMDVTLPLYLGASKDHLNDGAAVLGTTSMPVGGNSTNCVIAAHRGWKGKAMFRDVELLQKGDLVYLTNLWETLTYQVCDISIIGPDEMKAITLQPGRDMVTLLTCHPYLVGSERYLVYCQRVASLEEGKAQILPYTTQTQVVSQPEIEMEQRLQKISLGISAGTGILLIGTMVCSIMAEKRGKRPCRKDWKREH